MCSTLGGPSGREKMLYAFSQLYVGYQFMWMVEEDVFIPSVDAFLALSRLALSNHVNGEPKADVVTSPGWTVPLDQVDGSKWNWDKILPLARQVLPPQFQIRGGFVCVLGLSRAFITLADRFARVHGKFFFLESFFTTMADFWNLTLLLPAQLHITIVHRQNWTLENVLEKPYNMFHPVKNQSEHLLLQSALRDHDGRFQPANTVLLRS